MQPDTQMFRQRSQSVDQPQRHGQVNTMPGMRIDEDFSGLLATLLDDVVPTSSLQALPLSQWQSGCQPTLASAIRTQQCDQGPALSGGTDSASTGAGDQTARRGQKRSSSSGSRSRAGKVLELQHQLNQQLHELQQQLRRKLYLTERVSMLELLIEVREAQEGRLKEIRSGVSHNPFVGVGSTVKDFTTLTPNLMVQKLSFIRSCLATRLASIMPLLQKYPQLETYSPPAKLLIEVIQGLSLAEPTNPYGADGLPLGTLTVPVPADVLAKFAAAYSLALSSMSEDERNMLGRCAALVVEKVCISKAFKYGFFMLPELVFGAAVHVDAVAVTNSWQDLAATLNRVQLHTEAPSSGSNHAGTSATVAPEAHWHNVALSLGLTDKQKLQAAVLWEIISGAKRTIMSQRVQLAGQLLQLISPSEVTTLPSPVTVTTQPVEGGESGLSGRHTQQQVQQQSRPTTSTGTQQESAGATNVVAYSWLNPEQLTRQEILMQRLNSTLVKERLLTQLAAEALMTSILSPIQNSKAMVHSHPFFLAHLALLAKCAAECTSDVMDKLLADEGEQLS